MDFWRVLRVISARRWIILIFVALAAGSVFLATTLQSQRKLYEAEALLEPQELPLERVLAPTVGADGQSGQVAGTNSATAAQERTSRISDLVMLLRSSNDLYLKAARLLRDDEKDRAKEVGQILSRNGYFATYDANIATEATTRVAAKQLLPSQKQEYIKQQREALRKQVLDSLAKASDAQGSFAPTGVPDTEAQIAARIARAMKFDTVAGPLSTDQSPQIVNQIRVTGEFEREAEANLYVNMLCVAFIDYYTNRSAGAANATIEKLRDKLKQAEEALESQRKQLAKFRLENGVVATAQQDQLVVQLTRAEDAYNQTMQDLQDASGQVLSLQQSLLAARDSVAVRLPSTQNPQVTLLNSQIASYKIQLQQLRARNLGENNPEVLPVRAALEEAQRQLTLEINRPFVTAQASETPAQIETLLNQARARRDGLQQRLGTLSAQLAILRQQVDKLPQVQNRLNELSSSIRVAEGNVQDIKTRVSRYELLAVDNGRAGTVSIISQANASLVGGDLAAQRGKLSLLAGLFAAMLCVAAVVLFDALDPSVRTSQDAERLFGLPVEGVIPEQTPDPMLAAWVTYRSPDSPVAEAYRLLRTRLLFTAAEHPFQSLVMVTGRPGQGSTTTAANLAITLAQDGKRVILVDSNLRDPQLHNLFHSSNEVGLTTLLTVNLRLEDVVRPTAITNMELLPAGPMPLNPSELLGSPRMRYIHHELKKRADFIVFDTPSVIAFSDAAILASYVDATLLVVRANNVPRESEKQVRSLLEKARANLIGMVFNAVPADRVDAVGYHAHYYAASRRPDDSIGAAPETGFGHRDDGYGDMTPSGDLSLALLGDEPGDGSVHPVSPFAEAGTPASATTTEPAIIPARPAPGKGRYPNAGSGGARTYTGGNGSNGSGSNGSGSGSGSNGPTALLSGNAPSAGVATLERPALLHGNDEGDWQPEAGAPTGKLEGLDGTDGLGNGSSYDRDTQRLVDGAASDPVLPRSPEPASYRQDPAADELENGANADESETLALAPLTPDADEAQFAPPVDPNEFSSAATHTGEPGSVPTTVLATGQGGQRDSALPSRPRPGRGVFLLWSVLLLLTAGMAGLAVAIGEQMNVR